MVKAHKRVYYGVLEVSPHVFFSLSETRLKDESFSLFNRGFPWRKTSKKGPIGEVLPLIGKSSFALEL